MKSILLSVLMICLALFISCKKESVSNGDSSNIGKRINKIYYSTFGIEELSTDNGQTWTEVYNIHSFTDFLSTSYEWNKNQLLSSKQKYTYDTFPPYQMDYSYIGQVLYKITTQYNNQTGYMTFTYDDTKITQIEYYNYNKLYETCKILYSNEKPHEIWYYYKDGTVYYKILLWENENVSKIIKKDASGSILSEESLPTYDDKTNPYYGNIAFFVRSIMSEDYSLLSKNNYINNSWGYTCTYEYDGDYPTQQRFFRVVMYPIGNDSIKRETSCFYYNYKYLEFWQ